MHMLFSDSGLPPEFSSLLQQSQTDLGDGKGYNGNLPEMKTFAQKQPGGPVTPYATTALLQAQNARQQVGEINRGSYMSAHVLLNLLNELGKSDKMQGLPSILLLFRTEFNKFNNTGARILDSIYHMT